MIVIAEMLGSAYEYHSKCGFAREIYVTELGLTH